MINNFAQGKYPLSYVQLSEKLEIPLCLTEQILDELVQSSILSYSTNSEDEDTVYQPARDINHLSIKYITDALDQNGVKEIPVAQNKAFESLSKAFEIFSETIEKSSENILLKDIS